MSSEPHPGTDSAFGVREDDARANDQRPKSGCAVFCGEEKAALVKRLLAAKRFSGKTFDEQLG